MIEKIKELPAELEAESLGDFSVLNQGKVPIVDSRPMEKSPAGIALETNCRPCKSRRIEILAARLSRVLSDNASHLIGSIHGKNNGTAKCGAEQRMVVRFNQRDWKAG